MLRLPRIHALVFLSVAIVAFVFALSTNHVWEDYYITWRSSKNLATGHGLVYNLGDRLHTFTSPLGTLLPALASVLTLNSSDAAALWVFRLMSCFALGGGAVLLLRLAQKQDHARLAAALVIGWLALDAKIVDFAINGMETSFLILFLAYALWAHLSPGPRQWRHLGAAWAGLMWTRPDSFVYIGLLGAGFCLFNEPARTGLGRGRLLAVYGRASLLTIALYLPWLLFAWGYYGTPVPHTITAKSGIGDPRSFAGLARTVIHLPFTAWSDTSSMEGTFLPAYYVFGGWPPYLVQFARGLAASCSLLWLLPFLRGETRAASLAFFGAHAYLSYCPYFPFPWYLPSTTLLAVFCLGSLLAQALANRDGARHRQVLGFSTVAVGLVLAGNAWFLWESGRLFAAQQKYVEDANRRKIGEWLHANARPGDTVFLEPLGYIGYFSGLKTYDFPGMSSREIVAARRQVGISWAKLITQLKPQWVILRPHEVQRVTDDNRDLLTGDYELTREFSVAKQVAALDVHSRAFLEHDARFMLYERRAPSTHGPVLKDESPFPLSRMTVDDTEVTFAHAPSTLVRAVPRSAVRGSVRFGFVAGAYTDPASQTDGAIFTVELATGDTVTVLHRRVLDPAANGTDRGLQRVVFELPARAERAWLLLRTDSRGSMNKDWTCWSEIEFE